MTAAGDGQLVTEGGSSSSLGPSIVYCPELWAIYQSQVDSFMAIREDIATKVEQLRVPVEEFHCVEWEFRTRQTEINDLKAQLMDAEQALSMQQQQVLHAIRDTEVRKVAELGHEPALQHASALARPRVEEIRFRPNHVPEKVAGFAGRAAAKTPADLPEQGSQGAKPDLSQGSSGQGPQAAKPDLRQGSVQVSYTPHDNAALLGAQLANTESQLERQRKARTATEQTIGRLRRIHEEESGLVSSALRQQLSRIRQLQRNTRARREAATNQYLRLRYEHGEMQSKHDADVSALRASHGALSSHLARSAERSAREKTQTEEQAIRAAHRVVRSHSAGHIRARENFEHAQDCLQLTRERSVRLVRDLERELKGLKTRSKKLAVHGREELGKRRQEAAGLQAWMRKLESKAASAVTEVGKGAFGMAVADWPTFLPDLGRLKEALVEFEELLLSDTGDKSPTALHTKTGDKSPTALQTSEL